MVTAYQIDPKTGLVMVFVKPEEVDLTLTMLMRGIRPDDLHDPRIYRLLKGWELVWANLFPDKPIPEEEIE